MFPLSTRVLTVRSYRYLSLRPSCYATLRSCGSRYHYSTSRPTTQGDVLRVGKFVLGSLLAIGSSFYVFQYGYGLPILTARLEAIAANTQIASRGEFEELPYAHLKISGPEDLSNASDTGGASDLYRTPSTSSTPTYGSLEDVRKAIDELREALPGNNCIHTNPVTLQAHGSSENSYHPSFPHSVVVVVHSTEDVVKVVNISRKYRIPIIASGGATSLEGHFSGVRLNLNYSSLGYTDGDG